MIGLHTADGQVAIVGGGLAGGAAACLLARAGRRTVLFEREAEGHHKVCGEFLSGEAAETLATLDVDPPALGAAPIAGVRLTHGARTAEAELPFPAWGLSRRVLDAALLERAEALGAEVRRGQAVRAVEGGALVLDGGEVLRPRTVLLATGKHDLRGARRRPCVPPRDLVGIKLHLLLRPEEVERLAGWVEVHILGKRLPGGYAGLQMVEGGRANLCMLLPSGTLPRDPGGAGWTALATRIGQACPVLAARLEGARPLLARPPAIARVPYGFVHRAGPDDPDRLYRLGDQAGVIPSFCGDGMAIALHSAALAVRCLERGGNATAYHRRLRRDIAGQIGRAGWVARAADAWPAGLVAAARHAPAALRLLARLTRVPQRRRVPA